ncbi:YqcC family protein [Sodalis sp. C49]|uniref:YqcC family protein n=1 Tax=unclassified Sodalis (in: enterobacteria) TaxID=2636512 RepID=UPI003965B31A
MDFHQQVRQRLFAVEQAMRSLSIWQPQPPAREAFESREPFCIDTMRPEEWLQWILLPRMHALLDQQAALPRRFAITPYFEEAFAHAAGLLTQLQRLDDLLNIDSPQDPPTQAPKIQHD